MHRPGTEKEYIDLVQQAVFEVEELRVAMEYDPEGMVKVQAFIDNLETQIKPVYQQMQAGTYAFKNEDLPYMSLIDCVDDRILPFKFLLRMINETHRKGLDVSV